MAVEVTLRFEDPQEADFFLRGLEHGHVDGRRLLSLREGVTIVGEAQSVD